MVILANMMSSRIKAIHLPFFSSDDVCGSVRNVKFLNQGFYNRRCLVMFVTVVCFLFTNANLFFMAC